VSESLRAARERLAETMIKEAQAVMDGLTEPHLVYNFGGRDNTYEEHLLDVAPLDVRLSAMRAAGIAFDKATRIIETMPGEALDKALSLVDALARGFDMIDEGEVHDG
jgi:hypothetical protein